MHEVPQMIQIKHRFTDAVLFSSPTARTLREAVLEAITAKANLRSANLSGADLRSANLSGAVMVDGRVFDEYAADHLAGICYTPEVKAKAVAAWGKHSWQDCPMHCALGVSSSEDAAKVGADPKLVAAWVALYDGQHLAPPHVGGASEAQP